MHLCNMVHRRFKISWRLRKEKQRYKEICFELEQAAVNNIPENKQAQKATGIARGTSAKAALGDANKHWAEL